MIAIAHGGSWNDLKLNTACRILTYQRSCTLTEGEYLHLKHPSSGNRFGRENDPVRARIGLTGGDQSIRIENDKFPAFLVKFSPFLFDNGLSVFLLDEVRQPVHCRTLMTAMVAPVRFLHGEYRASSSLEDSGLE